MLGQNLAQKKRKGRLRTPLNVQDLTGELGVNFIRVLSFGFHLRKIEIYQNKTGSPALYTKFSVKEIGYNEQKEIILLVIVDNKNRVRFAYGNTKEKVYAPNVSASNASGKVYTGVDLDRAIKQMTGVKSREELERVWAEHPELHNNKEFRNITIDMQKTYPPRN